MEGQFNTFETIMSEDYRMFMTGSAPLYSPNSHRFTESYSFIPCILLSLFSYDFSLFLSSSEKHRLCDYPHNKKAISEFSSLRHVQVVDLEGATCFQREFQRFPDVENGYRPIASTLKISSHRNLTARLKYRTCALNTDITLTMRMTSLGKSAGRKETRRRD